MVPLPNFPFIGTTTADRFMNASLGEFDLQEKVISQIEMNLWKSAIMCKTLMKYGKSYKEEIIENLRCYHFSFSIANAPYLNLKDKEFKNQLDSIVKHYFESGFKIEIVYSKAGDHGEFIGMDNIPPETLVAEIHTSIKKEVFERYFRNAEEAKTNQ